MSDPRLVTHDDADDFEERYYAFVFGDRPVWWTSADVVYAFDPVGSRPEAAFFSCGLENAVGWLYAFHYDITSVEVRPGWMPDPQRPKDSGVPQHRLNIARQWQVWRDEREALNQPIQTRAIRKQLFAHAPRVHQPGVTFAFSELPALVRTHDPYEAARAASATVAEDQRAVEGAWQAFAEEVIAVFTLLIDTGTPIAPLLLDDHSSLQVPRKLVLSALKSSAVAKQVRDAYAVMPWRVNSWTTRADKNPYLPVRRWSVLTSQEQAELTHEARTDPHQAFRKATVLHYDHLNHKDRHNGHLEAREALIGRLAEWHSERYSKDLDAAVGAFDPAHEFYLGVSIAEAKAAAIKVVKTPFALLDVVRRANLT